MTAFFKSQSQGESPSPDVREMQRLAEENKRLHRAVEELSVLNEIALAVNSTMEPEEINELIVAKCVRRVGVEQGTIHLLGQNEGDLTKTLVRVNEPHQSGLPMRLNVQLTGWMMKYKRSLMVSDLATDERFSGTDTQDLPIKSLLAVPLELKGRLIGILNLFNKKSGDFTSDDARLVAIIASQCAQVIENARLYSEEIKLRRLEEDLRNASAIQRMLLPGEPPEIPGLELAGVSHPARDVGGDYYDFIDLGEGRWGIVVADVSGKGMPAALLMVHARSALRGFANTSVSAAECVTAVNRLLEGSVSSRSFVTLFYSVYDSKTKTLTYCNAGHNPPMWVHADGSIELLETGGLMCGVFGAATYDQETIQMREGECLLIFTDGVTEAASVTDEQFEEERLEASIRRHPRTHSARLIESILNDVLEFQGDAPVADDITMVCMRT